jgi:predicted secreted protein
MVQLPCPETAFIQGCGGLPRDPHGKKYYESLGFREHCASIGRAQAAYLKQLTDAGVQILGIMGMEFSPACAVNYLNRGPVIISDQGIFVEELKRELLALGLTVPFIGVNQRALKKLKRELDGLLVSCGEVKHA